MTTGIITIQDLVQREVLLCVSTLIDELRKKEGCIDEDTLYELYSGPIDYGAAKYELELERDYVFKHFCSSMNEENSTEDNQYYFGVRNDDAVWRIDPIFNSESEAIAEWFEVYHGGDLEDFRSEIYEHYVVSSFLANKLEALDETVVRDFYGLTIYCRPCTGQALHCDWAIQTIYNELINGK